MSAGSAREVESAVATLSRLATAGHAPSHYVARHVLLALGALLEEGPSAEASGWLERVRAMGAALGPPWEEAVRTELSLACGEFAQCLDPRYLALPNYDLEYTRSARRRLEDRLRAARELGFALQPREVDVLDLADRVLTAFEEGKKPS